MAYSKHRQILKQGVKVWNQWRYQNRDITPDFRRAALSGAYLSGANLSGANLSSAFLNHANLSGANLRGADLSGAVLSGASLTANQLEQLISLQGAIMPDGLKYQE